MKQLKIPTSHQNRNWFIFVLVLLVPTTLFFVFQNPKPLLKLDTHKYVEYLPTSKSIKISTISEFEKQVNNVNWKSIDAKSIYAINPETGKVYFVKNENEKLPIASITKLMTVYTSLNEYEKGSTLNITKPMPTMDIPIGLKAGDEILVSELFECSLVASKNDCANALAYQYPEGVDSFIKKMNENAKTIGMNNSNFSNPTGYINTNNYSTAKDLGRLSSVIVRYNEIVKLTDLEKSTIQIDGKNKRSVGISTTNLMLKENKNIKGLKTGFTFASGECLVLFYDFGNDEKLITVVLNASDRFRESRELYNLIVKAFN